MFGRDKNGRDRDPAHGAAAGRGGVPAHDDPVRDRPAELDPAPSTTRSRSGKRIFLSAQHDATRDNPGPDEIYTLGTICNIVQSLKLPDGNVKVLVEGLDRGARPRVPRGERASCKVVVKLIPRQSETGRRHRSADVEGDRPLRAVRQALEQPPLRRHARRGAGRGPGQARRHHRLAPRGRRSRRSRTSSRSSPPQERLTRIGAILEAEVDKLKVDKRIQGRVKKQMERAQKEYYLNEKMKAIQKELGRKDDRANETDELRKKIEQARMPKDAEEKALQELKRLESMPPMSAEATVSRNYLDWLIAVPWTKKTRERKDLPRRRADPERRPLRAREGQGAHRRVPGRAPARQQPQGPDPLLRRPARASARPRSPARSPAPRTASSCACRWAACATRPRSAATAAPTSAPSPARSSR